MRILPQGEVIARETSPVSLAVDVEEMDLGEVEQLAVEGPPLVHVAAIDIVREVIEIVETGTFGSGVPFTQPFEFIIIGRALGTMVIDEIEQGSADPDNGRCIQRLVVALVFLGAIAYRMFKRVSGIHDPPCHRRGTGAMSVDKAGRKRAWLRVDDIVDVALAPDGDGLLAVACHGPIAHLRKQRFQFLRLRMGKFNEFKTIGPGRVVR